MPKKKSYEQWEKGLTTAEQRVEDIVAKMQAGAWLTGVSERALAKEWDCDPNTVRHYAAEANRVVRRQLREDPEAKAEARAQLLQIFEVIRAKAMSLGDAQGLRVALDASRAYGHYLGIEPPKRLDVADRTDPLEGWSTEEKLAFARDGKKPHRALRRVMQENILAEGRAVVDAPKPNGKVH